MIDKDKLPYRDEETYSTDMNGYTNFTTVPEYQSPVHYENAFKDSVDTQKVTSLSDIVISNLIRKNTNGEIEFALIETTVPSTLGKDGYYGTLLEVPFFPLPTKEKLSYEEIVSILDKNILDLNLYMEGNSVLDDSKTPIHQSFTDQCGQFYVSSVSERDGNSDSKLHWFPISALNSYINLQLNGGKDNVHSSLQTLYALTLLQRKYKEELAKMPSIPFKLDRDITKLKLLSKNQVVKNSPRFTIDNIKYETPDGQVHYSTYSGSRDSIAAVLIIEDEKVPGKYNLVVSKQQRSPFVTNKDFPNGILNEFTGGMIEKGQSLEDAVIAEAAQEQTYSLQNYNLALLAKPFVASLSSEEFGSIFVAIANKKARTGQSLDKGEQGDSGEAISSDQEYLSLDDVSENLHLLDPAPVAAKLGVLLSSSLIKRLKVNQILEDARKIDHIDSLEER